ncbi:MAG: hypothetical protein JO340_03770 [Acidobacteriaceae bacterium]|nr:hypothetical protein [Acidobacteriaceae bacterium]
MPSLEQAAIEVLRTRVVPDRPISVLQIDQAENDVNKLFGLLHGDPERYS